MSKGKQLTEKLVFSRAKTDNLQNIRNLNLWGNDLEDLRLVRQMSNLEVLSISVNRISTLRDLAYCASLQEIYLRKNNIADIREIRFLTDLPNLKVLWLSDNPCATVENYRAIVIKTLPRLIKLDNEIISEEEREAAERLPIENYMNEEKGKVQSTDRKSEAGERRPLVKGHALQACVLLIKDLDLNELELLKIEIQKLRLR